MESPEKPPSVPIQSVVIQQPQQDQTATPNVVHVQVVTSNHFATISFVCGVLSFLLFGFTIAVDEYEACLFICSLGYLRSYSAILERVRHQKQASGKDLLY